MAEPKFKRILHNLEAGTMTYRLYDLVDIPENIDLVELRNQYSRNLEVTTWIDYIQSVERELSVETTNGVFDAPKMKATVVSALQNAVNNALEYLQSLLNFLAAEEERRLADERASAGEDDAEFITGDEAEEGGIPEDRELLETEESDEEDEVEFGDETEEPTTPPLARKKKRRKK